MTRHAALFLALICACPGAAAEPIVFNDDGGWCWFQDERAVIYRGKLVIGTVAAGIHSPDRTGDIELVSYDLKTGKAARFTLHEGDKTWVDDHNSPAFLALPGGELLAMYGKHGNEAKIYYRIAARAGDPLSFGDERVFAPSAKSRVTYSNLHWLEKEGRVYDFYRGLDNSFKPSYAWSADGGSTWTSGNVFIDVPTQFRHRPYVKYASNGVDTVHIAYTDGHPRDFDNSVYHVYYRDGKLHRSDGSVIRSMAEGLKSPDEGTLVFRGDKNNVAWVSDVHLDAHGRPYLVYSVQKNSAGMPPGKGGEDLRYRYARWTGTKWTDREIAYAGSKLYPGEDDYTGNIALDPRDPNAVYLSTNADPATGKPLVSRADGQRHWEIFRGTTRDGVRWNWEAVTRDSRNDNLRPIVPITSAGEPTALLWLRGKLRSYTDFDLDVVGMLLKRP